MKDMTGKKIGKLYVEEYIGSDKIKGRMYLCLCDCGMDRVLSKSDLSSYKSCGCNLPRNGSHKHPEYTVWRKMRERCYNPKQSNYEYYGAKGIKVCKEWNESFETFLYDMGPRPYPNYQLDRINSDGNYEPNNCRWVSKSKNMINRKSSLGEMKNIYKRDNGKYRVSIKRNGKQHLSKSISTVEEAVRIRDKMLENLDKEI